MRKLAWPYDPQQVLNDLGRSPHPGARRAAKRVRRGGAIFNDVVTNVPEMGRAAGRAAGRVGNAVVNPASRVGPRILRGLGSAVKGHPRLSALAVAGAAAAPMIAGTAHEAQQEQEVQLMNAYRDPGRPMVVTASLDAFLEKKAAQQGFFNFPGTPPPPSALRAMGSVMQNKGVESFASGVGAGVGTALLNAAFGALGSVYGKIRDAVVTDPRRQKLLESLMRSDPVISDALERHPENREMLVEAYGTMVRFAPTVSLDPNAVRSWLREAVLSGTGPNYASIKNLIETEKALTASRGVR